ncbi:MAG: DNA double-strand break repair nuclease NurA [Candidatus Woesearchaeota archaeon]
MEASAYFANKSYVALPFSREYFRAVKAASGDAVFVDGGNAELVESPTDSLQFIRTAAVKFSGKKRLWMMKSEFYAKTTTAISGNDAVYSTRIENAKGGLVSEIKMSAVAISEGGRMQASKMGNIARRVLELKMAADAAEKEKNAVIVLDGTLEAVFEGEDRHLQQLYDAAEKNGNIVVAVAKTNTVLATDGRLFAETLEKNQPAGAWRYGNVAEVTSDRHRAELEFVKLHEKSRHIFRLEVYKKQANEAEKAVNMLAMTANDVTFPGYPYGLIIADRIARVSESDAEYLKARNIESEKMFKHGIRALNAHEILDSM